MKAKWLSRIFIVILSINVSSSYGQFPDIQFDKLSVKEGLSQSTVTAITKDSIGFMWFGTYEGLNRYDGYEFKVYKVEDKPSNGLSDNLIKHLFVDSKGVLWVGTAKGLSIYDQEKDKFTSFKHDKNDSTTLGEIQITSIYEDTKGTVWIGTFGGGLNRFNDQDSTFTRFINDENIPGTISDNSIQCLYEDRQGNFWVGTLGGGLNKFDRSRNTFTHFLHDDKNINTIAGNSVHEIVEDKNGDLFLAVWEKSIDKFNVEKESFTHKYIDYSIYDIKLYNDNLLLAGSRNNGLVVYNIEKNDVELIKNISGNSKSLSSNSVYSIFIDDIGTMWLGTSGGGINKFNPKFNNFKVFQNDPEDKNTISNNYILSVLEDKQQNLWVGTRGGGLNFYNTVNKQWTVYKHNDKDPKSISNDIISSLYEDSKGNIWIGTETGGLNRFFPGTKNFRAYKHDSENSNSISSNWVSDIYEDADGIFWLCTLSGGLNRFDPVNEKFTSFLPNDSDTTSISGYALTRIYEDNENNLWISTFGYGLNKFNKTDHTFTRYRHSETDTTSLSIDFVLCVYQSKSGRVWIGTTYGLNRLNDDGTFTNITVYDGLPSNGVYGILEDNSENLWLSTNKGLAKYNPADRTVKVYDESDGLPGDELNFGPMYKSVDGKMFFGGPEGFFYFHPDSLKENDYLPPVVFTDFTILNKPGLIGRNISSADRITLNYDDKIFSLSFAALNYIQPSKNQYLYKLEGFSDNWIVPGEERKVTFTNLDPGDYTLKVKASNNDGFWNDQGRSLALTIIPPYWATWWFRSIIIIMLLAVGPIIYYRRITALKYEQKLQHEFSEKLIINQEQERSRIAQELHDSLGQELLLIKNRAMLGLKNVEESKTKKQLEYISEYSHSAIKRVRQISHNLRPPELDRLGLTETLSSIVNEIEDAGIIKITSSIENIDGLIQKEKEINILRILQEAVANIIKHAGADEIHIKVINLHYNIKVSIKDNGKGFDTEQNADYETKGLGFSGMKERAKILRGTLSIDSTPGSGTIINLEIPVQHV